jgi:hypothetical protein
MHDDQTTLLIQAVSKLTVAVEKLDGLLRDEYPKRAEVEHKFLSKGEGKRFVIKLTISAFVAVFVSWIVTVGSYSNCLVGSDNPSVCKYIPGYNQKIEDKDNLNDRISNLENQIDQLRQQR